MSTRLRSKPKQGISTPEATGTDTLSASERRYFSIAELASFGIPGFPRSRQNWYALVERERWPSQEVLGRGGRSGTRKEFSPPDHVLAWIDMRAGGKQLAQAPNVFPRSQVGSTTANSNPVPARTGWILEETLSVLIDAVDSLSGDTSGNSTSKQKAELVSKAVHVLSSVGALGEHQVPPSRPALEALVQFVLEMDRGKGAKRR
jgi:hypothetical protein